MRSAAAGHSFRLGTKRRATSLHEGGIYIYKEFRLGRDTF